MERTPYDKFAFDDRGRKLAERGYVYVIQDVRGRYASDGEFQPGFYSADHMDAEDGYDTVEWAAALPWSNGRVGTVGSSYAAGRRWSCPHPTSAPGCDDAPGDRGQSARPRDERGVAPRQGAMVERRHTVARPEAAQGRPLGPRTVARAEKLWTERDRIKWLWQLPLMDIRTTRCSASGPTGGSG